MAITLAFYKGRGDWVDRTIRWATRSPYSHVEIVISPPGPPKDGALAMAFSASGRDGGVRAREIRFQPGHWDYQTVGWVDPQTVMALARRTYGARYDWAGLVASQVLHLRRQSPRRWFCSELVATALGLPRPQSYSPGDLADLVAWINARAGENPPEE